MTAPSLCACSTQILNVLEQRLSLNRSLYGTAGSQSEQDAAKFSAEYPNPVVKAAVTTATLATTTSKKDVIPAH